MKKLNAIKALKLMRDGKRICHHDDRCTTFSVLDDEVAMERFEESQFISFADFLFYWKEHTFIEYN